MPIRKNFIFHNKKAVSHIEKQPNQSRYIEELVIKDFESPKVYEIQTIINDMKKELLSSIKSLTENTATISKGINESSAISESISNVLGNLV